MAAWVILETLNPKPQKELLILGVWALLLRRVPDSDPLASVLIVSAQGMGHVSGSMLAGVLGRVGLLAHLCSLARRRDVL